MQHVIVITGPTATGKTKVSIELAKLLSGEIISADSMQVYRHMNIGTAKPTFEEMCGVRHHLIDIVNPDEEFNVVKFSKLANNCIKDIINKGKLPVITGGTGLYINSLIYNYSFQEIEKDQRFRQRLEEQVMFEGTAVLHKRLSHIDPESAMRINPNDMRRIVRALEIFELTGRTMTESLDIQDVIPARYRFFIFGLSMDRELMYKRINQRVAQMFQSGLLDEIVLLRKMGYDLKTNAMQGLGYKEISWYMEGKMTLNEAMSLMKRNTRRYAKRQMTWFRRMKEIVWIEAGEGINAKIIAENIIDNLETSGIIL